MKGLLSKDLRLILMQKNFVFLAVIWFIVLTVMNDELTFLLIFVPYILSLLVVSTVSYDSFDNGGSFLFSLPFKRHDYVIEKYLLSALIFVFGNLIAFLISLSTELILRGDILELDQWLNMVLISFITVFIFLSFMFPLYLKYGSEKARIINILIIAFSLALLYGIRNLLDLIHFNGDVLYLNFSTVIMVGCAATLITYFISLLISIKMIKRKQF